MIHARDDLGSALLAADLSDDRLVSVLHAGLGLRYRAITRIEGPRSNNRFRSRSYRITPVTGRISPVVIPLTPGDHTRFTEHQPRTPASIFRRGPFTLAHDEVPCCRQ